MPYGCSFVKFYGEKDIGNERDRMVISGDYLEPPIDAIDLNFIVLDVTNTLNTETATNRLPNSASGRLLAVEFVVYAVHDARARG